MIAAIRAARAAARARCGITAAPIPTTGRVVVDLDATLIGAHSEKEGATPNFKRGFGFHPMLAFVDHGAGGTGEPLAAHAASREGQRQRRRRPDRGARRRAGPAARARCAPGCWCAATPARGSRRSSGTSTDLGLEYSVGVYGPPTRPGRAGGAARSRPGGTRSIADGQPRERRPGRRADPVAAGHLHRAGRPGCGSSPAANAPTPAPSCGSPTTRAGGSPCSPPTPAAAGWPTSRSATGSAPAPRTGSAG